MRIAENLPTPQVVMTLCRGYDIVLGEPGEDDIYMPTRATQARVSSAFDYYDRPGGDPNQNTLYLFSGWYGKVASRGRISEPPEGISEAFLAEGMFTKKVKAAGYIGRVWSGRNPVEAGHLPVQTAIEDKSIDTFTNFTESIAADHLVKGKFTADSPLVLSGGKAHLWRAGVIAEQAVVPEPNGLFMLPPSGYERGPVMTMEEWVLLAMTRSALKNVGETGGAEPGNTAHTIAAAQAFEEMSQKPLRAIWHTLRHPELWTIPEVPILRY